MEAETEAAEETTGETEEGMAPGRETDTDMETVVAVVER